MVSIKVQCIVGFGVLMLMSVLATFAYDIKRYSHTNTLSIHHNSWEFIFLLHEDSALNFRMHHHPNLILMFIQCANFVKSPSMAMMNIFNICDKDTRNAFSVKRKEYGTNST